MLDRLTSSYPSSSNHDAASFRPVVRGVIGAASDAAVGYCDDEGALLFEASNGGDPGVPPSPPLPPDQRDGVAAACRAARSGESQLRVIEHPHDRIAIAARRLPSSPTAWALVRIPKSPEDAAARWKVDLVAQSVTTFLLVTMTLSVLFALSGGVRGLESSLIALQRDLRAPLEEPSTVEFSRLTTGLRQMAQHLATAQDRERELLRDLAHRDRLMALGRVVAGLSHELRNPLAGVKLKLDVLLRSPDANERTKAEIRSCLDEIARLDRVVQSMLLVARKNQPRSSRVNLTELVDERAAFLDDVAGAAEVRVERVGDPSATASGDRDELARAIDNLLRNGIEASPRGGIVIAVVEKRASNVLLSVIDAGPGVPPEREIELFEPFSTSKPDGTGLGLWLSRAVVEAHGGTLTYRRNAARTEFNLSLPTLSERTEIP